MGALAAGIVGPSVGCDVGAVIPGIGEVTGPRGPLVGFAVGVLIPGVVGLGVLIGLGEGRAGRTGAQVRGGSEGLGVGAGVGSMSSELP